MSKYKKLDEWFPDGKCDGRKFLMEGLNSRWFQPYFKSEGRWYGLNELDSADSWSEQCTWGEYIEPKKTKKVKMYKPVYPGYDGTQDHYTTREDNSWHSDKTNWDVLRSSIVGWMEMDAEVTE